ncbi:TetR/AcrR family transcriptional regulator [Desulfatiferula olefinivorans]
MPKAPMSPEEIEQTRGKILDTALAIIIEQGFDSLSVRKIASRLGVTATTIYNYYKNKDELNLMIRVRGFEKLRDLLIRRSFEQTDPIGRIGAMIRAYVDFGLTFSSYYEIMFNLKTPKYLDYVGTPIEPLADHEKKTALSCLTLFVDPVRAILPGDGPAREAFILDQVVTFWADLHGLVTLCNSRLFHEVLDRVDLFTERRIAALIDEIARLTSRVEGGETLYEITSS